MRHLVTDGGADAAVVGRRVEPRTKVGRLQDGGGEHDLVGGGVVIGVHRLGRHAPLRAVHRLVQPRHLAAPLEGVGPLDVAIEVGGADLEPGVVAPLVRIADLDRHGLQLGLGLRLGLRAHPVERLDALAERGAKVLDQVTDLGLGLGREVAGDIGAAQGLAHHRVVERDAALPARALRRLAGQHRAAEGEMRLLEPVVQIRRRLVDQVEGSPGLEHIERRRPVDGGHLRQGGLFADHDAGHPLQLGRVEHGPPGISGGVLGQLLHGGGVIDLVRIAFLHAAPAGRGDPGFEGDHGLGHGAGVGPAGAAWRNAIRTRSITPPPWSS